MTEFVVRLANRPGMLASLTELLGEAGVNIEALAAYGVDGEGVVRLIVDDAAATRRCLADAGIGAEEHQVLDAFLPHRPGELARVARRLADAGVNIDAVYLLNTGADGLELAMAVSDPEAAAPLVPVRGSVEA